MHKNTKKIVCRLPVSASDRLALISGLAAIGPRGQRAIAPILVPVLALGWRRGAGL